METDVINVEDELETKHDAVQLIAERLKELEESFDKIKQFK